MPAHRIAVAIWLVFAVAYTALRSLNFTAVDGAVRSADVFHRGEMFFHGNHHLLYPFNVWIWNGALAVVGLGSADPIGYIRDTQLMNAIAGAGCVAAVYWIGFKLGKSHFLALVTACAYGVSRVALLHFTNGAEPPVGLFWSLVAIGLLIAGLERGSSILILISGGVLALALATYQSMLLIGGLAVALCMFWNATSDVQRSTLSTAVSRIALFSLGGLLATCAVFGSAYAYMGTPGVRPKILRFVTLVGNDVYGGITISKLVNLPVGFAASLLPVLPSNYSGLRSLLARPGALMHLLSIGAPAFVLVVVGFASAMRVRRRQWNEMPLRPYAEIALIGGLAIVMWPSIYWDPIYDKLWLQPLAIMALSAPILLRGDSGQPTTPLLRFCGIAVFATFAICNLAWAIPASTVPTPELGSARSALEAVRPNDLVICDWDGVSTLYNALAGTRYDILDLPSTAEMYGPDAATVIAERILLARSRGGSIFFLGVLDQTTEQWQTFLGNRAKLPYESLDEYRKAARPLRVLETNYTQVTLWILESDVPPGSAMHRDPLANR